MICLCDDRTVWHTVLCLALSLSFFSLSKHTPYTLFFLGKIATLFLLYDGNYFKYFQGKNLEL